MSVERRSVLLAVAHSVKAAKVADLSLDLGLHANTVREHLDALVLSGLVKRDRLPSMGRGRPSYGYHPTASGRFHVGLPPGDYLELLGVLADALAGVLTPEQAQALGVRWAARFPADGSEGIERILKALARCGFSPEVDESGGSVALRTCPLVETAAEHPRLICELHLGLIEGLADVGATLRPFAEEGACRLDFDSCCAEGRCAPQAADTLSIHPASGSVRRGHRAIVLHESMM